MITMTSPDPMSAPGPETISTGGFFSALFDFSFKSYITKRALSIIYVLAAIFIGLATLFFVISGLASGGAGAILSLIHISEPTRPY